MKKLILLPALFLLFFTATAQVTIHPDANGILYVDSAIVTSGDGSSWAKALQSFGTALQVADSINTDLTSISDSVHQIWVAKGTYQPASGQAFYMLPHVKIYGGFAGTESLVSERPSPFGGPQGAGVSILKGNNNTVISNYGKGLDSSAILDGFMITGGNGSGMYNGHSSPTLSNVIISGNVSNSNGGGIRNQYSSPTLINVTISGNSANAGGGMWNRFYSSPTLINVTISGNSAGNGGGTFNDFTSSPTLINVTISGNSANIGGGIYNVSPSATLVNVTISGNSANAGGGMYNDGSSPKLYNTIVLGNSSGIEGDEIDPSSANNLLQNDTSLAANLVFVNPIAPGTTTDGDYRLLPNPITVNAGNKSYLPPSFGGAGGGLDLGGNPRIYDKANGGIVDLGAYEFQGNPSSGIHPDANGILYVDSAIATPGDGSSWAKALQSFGEALHDADSINAAAATATDSVRQIWVAKGTYQPASGQSFSMLQHVKIYGSFAGTETSLAQRDLSSGDTSILKGNGNSVISNNNNGLDSSAVLDGFMITGGNTSSPGGGMYNYHSSPTLRNLTISGNSSLGSAGNSAGGGICNSYSSPTLINVIISGNVTKYTGGGMYNTTSSPTLINVTITGNSANAGGGMYNDGSSPKLYNTIVLGNSSGIYDGYNVTYGNKGGIDPASANNLLQNDTSLAASLVFVNPIAPGSAPTTDGDYRLLPNPIVVNAGDNSFLPADDTTDMDGNPRIYDKANGGIVDVGAYEFQGNLTSGIHPDANGILYVDSSIAAPGDGSSWAKALQSFGAALHDADSINKSKPAAADSVRQIWVAKGTYQPASGQSFYMLPHVKIYGSFAGTETSLAQRDLSSGDTSILKGNNNSVIRNDNNGLDSTAVLDGFTITGGSSTQGGGGIYNNHASPVLAHLVVRGNTASNQEGLGFAQGGGIYNNSSSPLLVSVTISGNSASGAGGAGGGLARGSGICNENNSSPVLINVTISGNSGSGPFSRGGGIFNLSSSPVLVNSIVWENTATQGNQIGNNSSSVTLVHSLYGNGTNDVFGGGIVASHTLTVDPLFVDPAGGNYQLQAASPAINAGINDSLPAWDSTDLAGNPRIYDKANGGIVDLGAYEYQGNPSLGIHPDANGILYVDSAIATPGDGSSWAKALKSFSVALHDADSINNSKPAAADSVRQIWVAKGTYQPASGQSFYMLPHVKIYGSFAGTESLVSERPSPFGGPQGAGASILKGNNNRVISNDNNGLDTSAVLDGFMITGGNIPRSLGGGIYNFRSSPILRNLTISGNSAGDLGGGMSNSNSSPTLINVTISGNSTNFGGGGGMNNYYSSPTLINVTISGNYSSSDLSSGGGGGMRNLFSSPKLYNTIVLGNSSGIYDGNNATYNNKGGIDPSSANNLLQNDTSLAANLVFVNPIAPGSAPTTDGDYRLLPNPIAVNAGNNSYLPPSFGGAGGGLDLGGNPRIFDKANGGIVDLGAYEFQGNIDMTRITAQPADVTTCAGEDATFTVAATGSASLTYEWESSASTDVEGASWNKLTGETTETLQLSNVQTSDSGTYYRVIVTGDRNADTSDAAMLHVNAIKHTLLEKTICFGGFYNFGGTNISQSGIYTDTLTSYTGCDSVVVLNLTVRSEIKTTLNKIICFGEVYPFDGTNISQSGTYTDTLTSYTGCDSVVVLNLTVRPEIKTTLDKTICFGGVYPFDGTNISQSGIYTDTLTSYTGCDSVVVLNLTVRPEIKTTLDKTICFGEVYPFDGTNISQSGTYTDTLTSYTGCDSVVVLNLTVRPEIKTTLNETICFGGVYNFGETNIAASGTYSDTLTSYTGCDSIVVLNLTVRPENKTTLNETICFGGVYNFGGTNIGQSGTYTDTLTSYTGCDSVVVLNLTVRPEIKTTLNETICFGSAYNFNGKNISASGTYKDTLTSYTGCDSVVVLNLTVRPEIKTTLDETICEGDFYSVGDHAYTQSGLYNDTLRSFNGCDSVVILHLTVNKKTVITSQPTNKIVCAGGRTKFTVKATGTNIRYQWQSSTDGTTWNNVEHVTSATLNLSDIGLNKNGTKYRVVITGACGNVTSDAVALTVNENTTIVTQPTNKIVCAGEGTKFTVKATGTNLIYQWQKSADGTHWKNLTEAGINSLTLSNLSVADNGLRFRVVVIGACGNITSRAVTLTVNPLPTIKIIPDSANPVSKGLAIQLTASGADSYRWASGPGIQNGWDDAAVTIRPTQDATYTVTGTTTAGCKATGSYDMKVIVDYKLICNNIVSPNGDGKNDRWIIQNIDAYRVNEVMIFDRAGRMIYHKKGYNNEWGATVVHRPIQEGTYYYVFKVDGGKKIFKGFIEVLKER